MSQRIAFIPARGGSKRLPRKNILNFHSKPMIAYSIEAALNADVFDAVVVSTENDEIADIAKEYGAVIDQRSPTLATDTASVVDVCLDYLNRYTAVTTLAVLYATAPLREAEDIRSVLNLLSEDCHFAMATTLCDWPVHQTLAIRGDYVSPVFPDLVDQQADALETYCIDNGSTYAVHVEHFLQQKTFYGDTLRVHLMPNVRSIDIDTSADFSRALYEAEKLML